MVHLYLDDTNITLKGLIKILKSIKESLKVRTISVRSCGLKFKGQLGEKIVELLSQNISLTKFGYAHNQFDPEFIEGMTKEIELNK